MSGQKNSAILEWVIFLGLTICAVVASEVIGLNQLWEDGVVYTVILFTAVLLALRPAWGRKSFWVNLAIIFAGHMIAVFAAIQEMSPRRFGFPKLLMIPLGAIEFVFIARMLRKRRMALTTSGPPS